MISHSPHPSYSRLVDRLNRFPQGAAPTETLYKILAMLFSEREAELVSVLPIQSFTTEKASKIWKMSLVETQKTLDELAGRALIVDSVIKGKQIYTMPPPMAGFFEFSMMRLRDDVDQQVLGELFYQYCNVEDDFIESLFTDGSTQLGRVYVNEPVLPPETHVLDYERSSEVIKTATHIGIGICYCRHKMEKVGKDCDAPKEICMTFNGVAQSLIKYDYARQVDVAEGLDLLQEAYENNLVQFGENEREEVNFICNCCGCCCEGLIAARRFAAMRPIHTSNFIPEVADEKCTGCGKCVNVCPVEAMTFVSANDPHKPKLKKAKLDEDICLGCGICARVCDQDGIKLVARAERLLTPKTFAHRAVLMAVERNKLQHLIFDDRTRRSHRVMAAVFGAILKLPPLKRALASKQLHSRYLEGLIDRAAY